jgi:hypothetical protein
MERPSLSTSQVGGGFCNKWRINYTVKQKPFVSESSPLLSKKHQDGEDCVHEGFNGALFSGAVFNLLTALVGVEIMALPATMNAQVF